MRLLLDTHAVLWALERPEQLEPSARAAIQDPANDVLVSPVSIWEIEIKRAAGKLRRPADMLEDLLEADFSPLPITWDHGLVAGALPPHHRDPFDRMLVAQAQREGLTIVTRDPKISRYQVSVLAA